MTPPRLLPTAEENAEMARLADRCVLIFVVAAAVIGIIATWFAP